jgi:multidrug resistance efflux pump
MRWFRQTRIWWVLGLLLLVASLVGARFYAPRTERDPEKPDPADKNAKRAGGGIVASGQIDTEFGMLPLVPGQAGEVLEVFVKDGQRVQKGQPLMRVDSRIAENQLFQARTAVSVAKLQLDKAKKGMGLWQKKVDGQLEAIAAHEEELKGLKESYEYLKKKIGVIGETPEYLALPSKIAAKERVIKAERIRLTAIEEEKPVLEQQLAQEGLTGSEQQLDRAKLGLDMCTLFAPSEGSIVRVSTKVGEKFGPQINVPAMWFRPKGEIIVRVDVDQEWAGRVKLGQSAVVFDAANSVNQTWKGKVTYVADTFLPAREAAALPNPFGPKQDNVLECRVSLDPGQASLPYIGQKVRVHIGGN